MLFSLCFAMMCMGRGDVWDLLVNGGDGGAMECCLSQV